MADRYLPGRVAPTRIGQGKTYSDMLNEQLAFIQKQRQENLDKKVAQQEKNREFRQQQLQNIYDFDISGMSPAHIKAISDMQKLMASSLDPNSEDRYTSSSQLVADLAQLNNVFGVAEAAKSAYISGLPPYAELVASGGVTTGSGGQMVGTLEDLDAKRALWDTGGFSGDIVVGGKAGERTITGISMVPGTDGKKGYVPGQQVDFFENTILIDGNLWRPELLPPPDRLAQMAENARNIPSSELNSNNIDGYVDIKYDNSNKAVINDIRRAIYDELLAADNQIGAYDDIKDTHPKLSEDAVKAAMKKALQVGIDTRDAAVVAPPVFDLSQPAPGGFYRVSEDQQFTINSSDEALAGKVFAIRFDDSQINIPIEDIPTLDGKPAYNIRVQFDRGNGKISEPITLSPTENTDEFRSLIRGLGQEGLTQLAISQGFDPMAAQSGDADPAGGVDADEPEERSEEDQRVDLEIKAAELQVRIQNAEEAEAALQQAGTLEGAQTAGVSNEAINDAFNINALRQELSGINTELGRETNESDPTPPPPPTPRQSTDPRASGGAQTALGGMSQGSNPNITPDLAEEAPQTAAAIENLGSGGTITNPSTGQPLDETASTDEMVDATTEEVASIIGIPLETMEGEMQDKLKDLVGKVMGDGGAWFDWYSKETGATAAWCAAFISNLLMRQDENFRETYGLSMYDTVGATDLKGVGNQIVTVEDHEKARKSGKKDRQANLQALYDKVEEGDLIFKRNNKSSAISHIGIFAGFERDEETGEITHFKLFGGNQDDNLNVTRYPIKHFKAANRVQADLLTKEEWETISALSVRDPGRTR